MNDQQLLRYSRHILMPQIDIDGQKALLNSHALIVGLGGLGSPVALYLAASGLGRMTLIDDDQVELSNLQRQIIHGEADIDRNKTTSAADSLQAINSDIQIHTISERLELASLLAVAKDVDVILDCSDNFATRFMLNKVSQTLKIPLVSAAAIRFEAQVSVYDPRQADSPCYHCLYQETDELDQSCVENGVLAPMLGVMGSIQALEAVKLLSGVGESLVGRLLLLDALTMRWQEIKLKRDKNCPDCGAQ